MRKNANSGPKNQSAWDVLAGLSCAFGQLNNVPAILIPYLQDKELIASIPDQARFNRLASTLDRDVRDMTQQFRSIYNQHCDRHGHARDSTELMQTIDIQEQYLEWGARFDDVVIPTFTDMVEMIKAAGGDVSGIVVPSAAAVAASQDH